MGLTYEKKKKIFAKCCRLELTTLLVVTLEELVNNGANMVNRDMHHDNDSQALSTVGERV